MTVRTPAPPDSPRLSQEVQRRRKTIQNALLDWAQTASRRYPWRQRGRTPYQVLVAELLLKRTTSTAAARIYEDFLERFPSFESLAAASQEELEAALATVGLQRQRAKAASEMAAYVLEQWDGDLPADIEQLLRMPLEQFARLPLASQPQLSIPTWSESYPAYSKIPYLASHLSHYSEIWQCRCYPPTNTASSTWGCSTSGR